MIRSVLIVFLSVVAIPASAFSWQDLWLTPDQQGQNLMNNNQYAKAKDKFERKDWSATAAYRTGDYKKSAEMFKELNTQQGYYNQGNSLAHQGLYEEAIKAYDQALALNPKDADAKYNKKVLEDLLKKDKEKQQNKDQQNKDQQNKDQQNKDQQNKDQQNKDQQNKDQQNKDQQNKDQQIKQASADSEAQREKQQAKDQWLRLIPDDPGGLMREKFLRDHIRRERGWYQ